MYYIIYRVCKETWLYLPRPMSLQRIFSCFRRKLSIFEESNVANTLVRLNSGMASVTQFLKFPIFRRSHVLKNAKFSRNSRFLGVPILSEPVQFVKSKINIGFLYILYSENCQLPPEASMWVPHFITYPSLYYMVLLKSH